MAKLNIYKIDDKKIDEFTSNAADKLKFISIKNIVDNKGREFGMSLYMLHPQDEKGISWNWLLREFERNEISVNSNPKALIEIKVENTLYVATFGTAYFFADKFCDRKFPFEFAKRSDYKDIKTTALISPSRQRNKIINTYIRCNELEYDSGESFSKIKANMKIKEDEERFNGTIEIGNSIRFSMKENSLENIVRIINYIESTMNKKAIHNIPLFNKIEDERIERLDNLLIEYLNNQEFEIEISEMDIIGVNEIFYNNDYIYTLKYGKEEENIDDLNYKTITSFIDNKGIDKTHILDIQVILYQDGNFVGKKIIKELVDFMSDEEEAVLSNGIWYEYNEDYLKYLTDSLSEIPVIYDKKFDYSKQQYEKFIQEKSDEEGIEKTILKKKYYKEFVFNTLMEQNYGFKNYDRKIENGVESMDLYNDRTMYAVKIGNTSSKLCYVVDQSISSLKMYKSKLISDFPEIDAVAIWIILERKNKLNEKNGRVDINELNMLMLKNKIDSWKKTVRLMGYKPIIYINYYEDN